MRHSWIEFKSKGVIIISKKESAQSVVREIRRKTHKKYSAEEKIRIALEGLRGEESITGLCHRE